MTWEDVFRDCWHEQVRWVEYRYRLSRAHAEDIVQEAYTRLWTRDDPDPALAGGYIKRIVAETLRGRDEDRKRILAMGPNLAYEGDVVLVSMDRCKRVQNKAVRTGKGGILPFEPCPVCGKPFQAKLLRGVRMVTCSRSCAATLRHGTHCKRGHERTPENRTSRGGCRPCKNARDSLPKAA